MSGLCGGWLWCQLPEMNKPVAVRGVAAIMHTCEWRAVLGRGRLQLRRPAGRAVSGPHAGSCDRGPTTRALPHRLSSSAGGHQSLLSAVTRPPPVPETNFTAAGEIVSVLSR